VDGDFAKGHSLRRTESLHLSPDSKTLALIERVEDLLTGRHALAKRQVWLWDLGNGKVLERLPGEAVGPVVFSPTGKRLLYSTKPEHNGKRYVGKVWEWELNLGRVATRTYDAGAHHAGVEGIAFSADGKMFVTHIGDPTVLLWSNELGFPSK